MAPTTSSVSSNKIAADVCAKSGHDIQSLPQTPMVHPIPGEHIPMLIPAQKILCVRCGLDIERIQTWTRNRSKTKPKGAEENATQ